MTPIALTSSRTWVALTFVLMLSACGGSGDSAPASGGLGTTPPVVTPPVIEGIATPSSVSVVTATNAS